MTQLVGFLMNYGFIAEKMHRSRFGNLNKPRTSVSGVAKVAGSVDSSPTVQNNASRARWWRSKFTKARVWTGVKFEEQFRWNGT